MCRQCTARGCLWGHAHPVQTGCRQVSMAVQLRGHQQAQGWPFHAPGVQHLQSWCVAPLLLCCCHARSDVVVLVRVGRGQQWLPARACARCYPPSFESGLEWRHAVDGWRMCCMSLCEWL
jgi:hypothetical protein